jgi:hypothetical protein
MQMLPVTTILMMVIPAVLLAVKKYRDVRIAEQSLGVLGKW